MDIGKEKSLLTEGLARTQIKSFEDNKYSRQHGVNVAQPPSQNSSSVVSFYSHSDGYI
jgi:hypothetical protein